MPTLAEVLDILHEIAPLELAAEWDNTGVLLQASARPGKVARVLLAIDLTMGVVAEAIALRAPLIVSYHPPIFAPLKHLVADGGVREALLRGGAAGLTVYSPHTALDAAPSGLADWLAECVLGGDAPKELRPCGDGEFGRVVELGKALPFAMRVQYLVDWGEQKARGQAARAAGLKQGDVIVAFAGKRDFVSFPHLHAWVALTQAAGTDTPIVVWRDGKEHTLRYQLPE